MRFTFARPRAAYLRLDLPRDVIERPIAGDLDVNGWDVFKALRLLRKSNPPIIEWLFSPIIYREPTPAIATLRDVTRRAYSPLAMFAHYRAMASGNFRSYIENKDTVRRKKYLYALRPLAAMYYLDQFQAIPPTDFAQTLAAITLPESVHARITQLVADKAAGVELDESAPDAVLNTFIADRLNDWSEPPAAIAPRGRWDTAELDAILASMLADADATT